jgi:hypothetical protein
MKSVLRDFMNDSPKKSPRQNELHFSYFSEKIKFEVSIIKNVYFQRPSFCHNVFTYVKGFILQKMNYQSKAKVRISDL